MRRFPFGNCFQPGYLVVWKALIHIQKYDSDAKVKCDLDVTGRWFVAQTLAAREPGANEQLKRQGFRTFLPYVMRNVSHARKVRRIRTPLFPGYLFVGLDLQRDRWRSVNGTYGVSRLIMGAETPLPVPRGIVEALISHAGDDGLCVAGPGFAVGQDIRVVEGPFAQVLGRIVRLDGNGRVRALLEIMGGQVSVMLAGAALEAV